jgi:hypothetical protein
MENPVSRDLREAFQIALAVQRGSPLILLCLQWPAIAAVMIMRMLQNGLPRRTS